MSFDRLDVLTADNVGIEYATAGIGSRLLAMLLDLGIAALVTFIAELFVIALAGDSRSGGFVAGGVGFFIVFGYFVILEGTSGGRTPGKRALHLRAVRADGGAVGLTEALVRGLVRPFDIALGGVVAMFVTQRSRRFGDFAAGTVVVRDRSGRGPAAVPMATPRRTPDAGPAVEGIDRLGPAEAVAVRAMLARGGLPPERRAALVALMATRLLDRMDVPATAPERMWPPELLLERVLLQMNTRGPGRP